MDLIVIVMPCNIDKPDLAVDNSSIPAMTRCAVTVKRKAMRLDDRDKLAKRTS
jgi:hypothetical protein